MSIPRAAPQLLPTRSVHLRIVPRPANLSESREIFRVLQRFGDISIYKSLRYEYHNPADNIALAIFRDANSAQQALDASPIRFALEKEVQPPTGHESTQSRGQDAADEDDDGDLERKSSHNSQASTTQGIDDMINPSGLLNRTEPVSQRQSLNQIAPPPMPFDPPASSPPLTRTKWFQVTVDRSHAVHQDHIERQPIWKQYDPMKSMAQQDLAKGVPHLGLSDISKRPLTAYRTPNKVLKQMSDYVERAMPSLRGMAENNVNERRFQERSALGRIADT